MNPAVNYAAPALAVLSMLIAGCAGSGAAVRAPAVDLATVEVVRAEARRQTFELGFSLHNPNPFPLPVRGIRYQIRLNDQGFVGGESVSPMTLPAEGDGVFAITVDFDLLGAVDQVSNLLRGDVRDNLSYELHGKLDLDLPIAPSIAFTSEGTILLQTAAR